MHVPTHSRNQNMYSAHFQLFVHRTRLFFVAESELCCVNAPLLSLFPGEIQFIGINCIKYSLSRQIQSRLWKNTYVLDSVWRWLHWCQCAHHVIMVYKFQCSCNKYTFGSEHCTFWLRVCVGACANEPFLCSINFINRWTRSFKCVKMLRPAA